MLLDKWQVAPLRLLNLVAFVVVLYGLRSAVRWVISREPFITLGRASPEVFCAHLLFVFVGLALLYGEVPQLHGIYALALLAVTFPSLIYMAKRHVYAFRNRSYVRCDQVCGALSCSSQSHLLEVACTGAFAFDARLLGGKLGAVSVA